MYKHSFYITDPTGNNSFSYEERKKFHEPKLFVPSLIEGNLEDLKVGEEVVFEEIEDGKLRSCIGLKHFIQTSIQGVPTYIFDNHNHAFFFWHLNKETLGKLPVVHIDQHSDLRIPEKDFDGIDAFAYANEELNVGNFIIPAQNAGIVGEVIQVTGENLPDLPEKYILDFDVDYFAPEMDYISFEKRKEVVLKSLAGAQLITIATSPYFIDQQLAIEKIKELFNNPKLL